jgi:hypothetical protein
LHAFDSSLNAQSTLGSDFPCDPCDFGGKDGELVHHSVDSVDEIQNFTSNVNSFDLGRQVSDRHGSLQACQQ